MKYRRWVPGKLSIVYDMPADPSVNCTEISKMYQHSFLKKSHYSPSPSSEENRIYVFSAQSDADERHSERCRIKNNH